MKHFVFQRANAHNLEFSDVFIIEMFLSFVNYFSYSFRETSVRNHFISRPLNLPISSHKWKRNAAAKCQAHFAAAFFLFPMMHIERAFTRKCRVRPSLFCFIFFCTSELCLYLNPNILRTLCILCILLLASCVPYPQVLLYIITPAYLTFLHHSCLHFFSILMPLLYFQVLRFRPYFLLGAYALHASFVP